MTPTPCDWCVYLDSMPVTGEENLKDVLQNFLDEMKHINRFLDQRKEEHFKEADCVAAVERRYLKEVRDRQQLERDVVDKRKELRTKENSARERARRADVMRDKETELKKLKKMARNLVAEESVYSVIKPKPSSSSSPSPSPSPYSCECEQEKKQLIDLEDRLTTLTNNGMLSRLASRERKAPLRARESPTVLLSNLVLQTTAQDNAVQPLSEAVQKTTEIFMRGAVASASDILKRIESEHSEGWESLFSLWYTTDRLLTSATEGGPSIISDELQWVDTVRKEFFNSGVEDEDFIGNYLTSLDGNVPKNSEPPCVGRSLPPVTHARYHVEHCLSAKLLKLLMRDKEGFQWGRDPDTDYTLLAGLRVLIAVLERNSISIPPVTCAKNVEK
eukprot:TRINITY_DN19307_c2_g4_i1.p1 TRINITY_DN19307_c2_g4~~TRINITY_DN19307_c2_g4_i1.p1  ORF type:complete len:389 (+),score=52.13 TRINITY_DN19307_c2_g4_i1:100-1266(+)